MSERTAQNERIARLYLRVFNDKDLDLLPELLCEDFVSHLRVGELRGIDAFRDFMREFFRCFTDTRWDVDEWLFTEDRVVIRYHWQATHVAPFAGIPASNKLIRCEGLELLHMDDGKIREIWNYTDLMGVAALLHSPAPLSLTI